MRIVSRPGALCLVRTSELLCLELQPSAVAPVKVDRRGEAVAGSVRRLIVNRFARGDLQIPGLWTKELAEALNSVS